MADDPTTSTAQGQAGTATGQPEPDWKALYESAQADAEKWKAMSRKNEGKAKQNADAADQLANLSQRLESIENENASLKRQAARSALVKKVAAATGVPEGIVSSLAADDEESLTKAAKAIGDAYGIKGGAPAVPEAGVFPQGSVGKDDEMRSLARQIFGTH